MPGLNSTQLNSNHSGNWCKMCLWLDVLPNVEITHGGRHHLFINWQLREEKKTLRQLFWWLSELNYTSLSTYLSLLSVCLTRSLESTPQFSPSTSFQSMSDLPVHGPTTSSHSVHSPLTIHNPLSLSCLFQLTGHITFHSFLFCLIYSFGSI